MVRGLSRFVPSCHKRFWALWFLRPLGVKDPKVADILNPKSRNPNPAFETLEVNGLGFRV